MPATVTVGEKQLSATTLEVSRAGLSLKAFWSLPPGTSCRVELRWEGRGRPEVIHAEARVLHSAAVEGGFRVGMQFGQLDEASRAVLSALLA